MTLSCTIASLFLLVLLLSCGPSGLSDKALEDILSRRYGRAFTVDENDYTLGINKYQYVAHLEDLPGVKIQGQYAKGGPVGDNYPQMLHGHQAKEDAEVILEKYYARFAVKFSVPSYYEHDREGEAPISFLEMAKDDSLEKNVLIDLYLFDTVAQVNRSEMLAGITALINHYDQWTFKRGDILVKFWDKRFLEGRDFESLNFGFNHYYNQYVDSLSVEGEYVRQGLNVRFSTPLKRPISEEDLYAAIGSYDKGNGFEKKFFE